MSQEGVEKAEEREEVVEQVNFAKEQLKIIFGIEDLSNIELFRLEEAVNECIVLKEEQLKMFDNKEIPASKVIDVEYEAIARWLLRLYGIKWSDVPHNFEVTDKNTGEVFRYENSQELEYLKKRKEISSLGHARIWGSFVPEDFKEYLRRKREDSHLI
jgi:hypothetical protein